MTEPTQHELDRLFADIEDVRAGRRQSLKTEKLLASGQIKIAKKVGEEGVEIAVAAMAGHERQAMVITESADLFYNLCVLWSVLGVSPDDVWQELERRRTALGLAEKLGGPRPP